MCKHLSVVLTLLALVAAAPVLSACNTVAGAGHDVSDAGRVVTYDANHTPR
jgi:predicted small secreted protein